jgi:hypothetical protein
MLSFANGSFLGGGRMAHVRWNMSKIQLSRPKWGYDRSDSLWYLQSLRILKKRRIEKKRAHIERGSFKCIRRKMFLLLFIHYLDKGEEKGVMAAS